MIQNVKLFVNENLKSIEVAKVVKKQFNNNGFNIVSDNFDLGIAIGGDGSFLRMIKNSSFSSNPYYVGINSGTLGFMQEVKINEIDKFIDELKKEKYFVDVIGIQETKITHRGGDSNFCSLNEIVIRDENFKLFKSAKNSLLPIFSLLNISKINSKSYRTISNSIIVPDHNKIIIRPMNKDLMITIDGENNIYNDVDNITTEVADKKIKCLRFSHYNFPQKINEKLISN